MIAKLLAVTVRHRRPILVGGVVVAGIMATLIAQDPRGAVSRVGFAAAALLILLFIAAGFRRVRPTAFGVRPDLPAFVTSAHAQPVYTALFVWLLAAYTVGLAAAPARSAMALPAGIGLLILYAGSLSLSLAQAWIGFDVSLRPDGLYDRRGLGRVFVPWKAISAAYVARQPNGAPTVVLPPVATWDHETRNRPTEVRLAYAHPELVRSRGLVRGPDRLFSDGVDAAFLAAAITFYATHPQDRAGIGTDEGYRRLRQALTEAQQ